MENIINLLPKSVSAAIEKSKCAADITEVRLHTSGAVSVKCGGTDYCLEEAGLSFKHGAKSVRITQDDINNLFYALCNNSVYAHQSEISEGFIALKGGGRAGICGTVTENGIRDITSVIIRIPHEIKGAAKEFYRLSGGLLICGPPHSGKTTFLRDYIRAKSESGKACTVVDSRGEIAANANGKLYLDVGENTSVISFCEKAVGIERALRTTAPDIIAFDEIGNRNEVLAICDCFNAGADIVTSLHCRDISELKKRNSALELLQSGAFENVIMLDKNFGAKLYGVSDVLNENIRRGGNNACGSCDGVAEIARIARAGSTVKYLQTNDGAG